MLSAVVESRIQVKQSLEVIYPYQRIINFLDWEGHQFHRGLLDELKNRLFVDQDCIYVMQPVSATTSRFEFLEINLAVSWISDNVCSLYLSVFTEGLEFYIEFDDNDQVLSVKQNNLQSWYDTE